MLSGGFDQKRDNDFGIKTFLLQRFEVLCDSKDQAIGSWNQLRTASPELRDSPVSVGFGLSES